MYPRFAPDELRRGRILRGLACVLALLAAIPVPAAAVDPALAQEAMIFIKILGYERRVASSGTELELVVLRGAGSPAEQRACDAFGEALEEAASRTKLEGRTLRVHPVAWRDAPTLAADLAKLRASAMLLCDGLEEQAGAVAEVARGARVLTVARRRDLAESTVAVGIVRSATRVEIVVNLIVAEAEGASFRSDLLQLATVIR